MKRLAIRETLEISLVGVGTSMCVGVILAVFFESRQANWPAFDEFGADLPFVFWFAILGNVLFVLPPALILSLVPLRPAGRAVATVALSLLLLGGFYVWRCGFALPGDAGRALLTAVFAVMAASGQLSVQAVLLSRQSHHRKPRAG